MSTLAPPQVTAPIDYPDSDGLPMAENTLQYRWITTIVTDLRHMFSGRPDVFVAGDLSWYPVEGNREIRMAPDVIVALGRPRGDRGSYRQWEEGGIAPQVVLEIVAPGNRAGKMREKLGFYSRYGAQEDYVYDPDRMALTGYLREQGRLVEIGQMNGHVSPQLGTRFEMGDKGLTIFRPDGKAFIAPEEHADRQEQAEERARQERERADRLQQELDRLRGTSGPA